MRAPLGHQPHRSEPLDLALRPRPPRRLHNPTANAHIRKPLFSSSPLNPGFSRVECVRLRCGRDRAQSCAVQAPRVHLRGQGSAASPRNQSARMQSRSAAQRARVWFDATSLCQMESARSRSDRRRTSSGFYLPQKTLIIGRRPKKESGDTAEGTSLGIRTRSTPTQVTGWMRDVPGDSFRHKRHAGASYALDRRTNRTGSSTIRGGAPAHLDPAYGGCASVLRPAFAGGSTPAQGRGVWSPRSGMLDSAPPLLQFSNLICAVA